MTRPKVTKCENVSENKVSQSFTTIIFHTQIIRHKIRSSNAFFNNPSDCGKMNDKRTTLSKDKSLSERIETVLRRLNLTLLKCDLFRLVRSWISHNISYRKAIITSSDAEMTVFQIVGKINHEALSSRNTWSNTAVYYTWRSCDCHSLIYVMKVWASLLTTNL